METSQLKCMIQCDPILNRNVIGVFAADRLPTELPPTTFGFIANTESHTQSGQHWCAFFGSAQGKVDFLDTYGRTPMQNSSYFQQWLDEKANAVQINRHQIQSDDSTLCGLYCILFLHQRLSGYSYQDFLNLFDVRSLDTNDAFVADTMLEAFCECLANEVNHRQTCTSFKKCFS